MCIIFQHFFFFLYFSLDCWIASGMRVMVCYPGLKEKKGFVYIYIYVWIADWVVAKVGHEILSLHHQEHCNFNLSTFFFIELFLQPFFFFVYFFLSLLYSSLFARLFSNFWILYIYTYTYIFYFFIRREKKERYPLKIYKDYVELKRFVTHHN